MQKIINQVFIGMLFCVITILEGYAQARSLDSLITKTAAQNLVHSFNLAIKEQSRLQNGALYQFYLPPIKGSAYFNELQEFTKGSLVYDGFSYENMPLLYDMHRDLLISILPDGYSKYSLVSEKVKEFKFAGHHFVYLLNKQRGANGILNPGFYDLIYNGNLKLFVKRSRAMQEVKEPPYLVRHFIPSYQYFLEKDGIVYPFSSQGSFLKLFKNQKSELKKYLRKSDLKFRDNPEAAMVLLASYYDKIPN